MVGNRITKYFGWVFLTCVALVCLLFFSFVAGWDFPNDRDVFGPGYNGGASNAPIMLGLFAIAGSYLITRPNSDRE